MAWYPYSYKTAFDPATRSLAPAGSVGQVYAVGDTDFTTPLVTHDLTGLPVELSVQGEAGYIPSFQVEDNTSVIWKSGEYVLELTTTMPLPGPTGARIVDAVDNGDGTITFQLSDGSTVGPVTVPEGPQGERGPAGYNATGAVEDQQTLADYVAETAGPNPFSGKLKANYARRVGGVIDAGDKQFAGGFTYDSAQTPEERAAALRSAFDKLRGYGGTLVIPAPESPLIPAAFAPVDTVTLPPRINLVGASKLGARLQAMAGIQSAIIKAGATDGSDPNWHWGEIRDIYLDGNKANQTAMPVRTLTNLTTTGYVATITSAGHGFTVGDVVQVAGSSVDAYNGIWRVESVLHENAFTIQILTLDAPNSTVGMAQVMLNLLNVGKGGETSKVSSVYGNGAFNSGIFQGTNGTPMRYENVSMFHNNDYGFDLWCDRPIQMDTPSGDFNGKGLIRLAGKSSAGGNGTDSSVLINNIKAEHHLVPAVLIDDFDGNVTMAGGNIDMEGGNTAAPIQRTKSPNSSLLVLGTTINKRATGNIFEDLSTYVQSVTSNTLSVLPWTFSVSKQPVSAARFTQGRNDIIDTASTIVINLHKGTMCRLPATRATRVIGNPTGQPVGSPNAYQLIISIENNSGATTTTSWGPLFMVGPWTDPAPGKSKTITFWWDGSIYRLVSISPEF